jgi:hypothetical protein
MDFFNQRGMEVPPITAACRRIKDKEGFQMLLMELICGLEEKGSILSAQGSEVIVPNPFQVLEK